MAPFRRLKAWQAAYKLGLAVVRSTDRWPKREMFGLSAQARRAAYSVALNIAEGCVKRGRREFRRYLDIALGSVTELEIILLFARDLGFISQQDAEDLETLRGQAGRLTWRLYERISRNLT